MSAETDKDKKTLPAQPQAAASKAPQASPKPMVPAQPQASSPAPVEPAAPAFPRRRVWPD